MSVQAVGISLSGRYILLDDDTTLPIVDMLDINGEDTTDPDKCVGVIFQLKNGRFSVVDVRLFDADQHIRASS